jgi:hypothetical protein
MRMHARGGDLHMGGSKALDVSCSRLSVKQCARHIEVEAGARVGAGLGRCYDGLRSADAMSDGFSRRKGSQAYDEDSLLLNCPAATRPCRFLMTSKVRCSWQHVCGTALHIRHSAVSGNCW